MKIPFYQIDAFTDKVFQGNPAAVCMLDEWLSVSVMQSIAAENNLAETAFCVANDHGYAIRWFTPQVEVDLCGHATLATAHVLFNELAVEQASISFQSNSGRLYVRRRNGLLELNFPAEKALQCAVPNGLCEALGANISICLKNVDYLVVLQSEQMLTDLRPDFEQLQDLEARGVIVTAPSTNYDFVSRFFAPAVGVNEDPVTGSAFTKLIPYWAERLDKTSMQAKQISARGGEVHCELAENRVLIAGNSVLYAKGEIII
ncbi:MAG: PhzF family phenazine biosynthesis protein [Cryomorphaceae bacterium]|jgi:PhzF family phenazine biosynthesis protein